MTANNIEECLIFAVEEYR